MKYFAFAVLLAACTADPPVTQEELVEPRQGRFDPTDYTAQTETYRLLGIEAGDGILPRSAIVADTKTWSTKALHEGERVGRSARIQSIDDQGVTLARTTDTLRLERGHDLTLRVARHRLDVVSTPLGKHRHAIDPAAAKAALDAHGAGVRTEPVTIWDRTGERITQLDPEGLFAKAGFEENDLVLAPLDPIATTLAESGELAVEIVRHGTPMRLEFSKR
jgi:hypothetical protein